MFTKNKKDKIKNNKEKMHPVEFTWYKAIVLITAAMGLGIGILNIVYFNRIRLNTANCTELTSGEANAALWLNIALVIFSGILFFWSLFRLIFTGEPSKDIVHKTYNTFHHSPPPSVYTSPETYAAVGSPSGPAVPIQIPSPVPSPASGMIPVTATTVSYPLPASYTGSV